MTTADLAAQETSAAVPTGAAKRSIVPTIAALVVVALVAYFVGDYFGYTNGYKVAYTAEHSHYMFEKRRADKFQKRITDNRRCIDKMASAIDPVEDGGLVGIAESMQRIGLIYWGTVKCNQDAGFGYVTQQQFKRILPSAGN